MNDAESNHCPRCGASLAAKSPAGVCTRCALELALLPTPGGQLADPLILQDIPVPGRKTPNIGGYEILGVIAHGGMGAVFRARQRSLNRIVALKLLLAGARANATFKQRFRREAEVAARLQHPNIVPIFEVGEHEGQPFFSMEFVDGPDLARRTRERLLTPSQAAEYMAAVAVAVEYAHHQGVVHRDLKPSNILIGPDDRPRITDFGLARRLSDESDLTLSGATLGTPGYLPPEQASTKRGQVGPRSDIYGLGAVLYHLLTGRAPFMTGSAADTLQQVLETEPAPPRALNRDIPRDLETICLKCLQKSPSERYASARDVAGDLRRWLNKVPIEARPPGLLAPIVKWRRRRPAVAALLAALLLTISLAAAGLAWQWNWMERLLFNSQAPVLHANAAAPADAAGFDAPPLEAPSSRDTPGRTALMTQPKPSPPPVPMAPVPIPPGRFAGGTASNPQLGGGAAEEAGGSENSSSDGAGGAGSAGGPAPASGYVFIPAPFGAALAAAAANTNGARGSIASNGLATNEESTNTTAAVEAANLWDGVYGRLIISAGAELTNAVIQQSRNNPLWENDLVLARIRLTVARELMNRVSGLPGANRGARGNRGRSGVLGDIGVQVHDRNLMADPAFAANLRRLLGGFPSPIGSVGGFRDTNPLTNAAFAPFAPQINECLELGKQMTQLESQLDVQTLYFLRVEQDLITGSPTPANQAETAILTVEYFDQEKTTLAQGLAEEPSSNDRLIARNGTPLNPANYFDANGNFLLADLQTVYGNTNGGDLRSESLAWDTFRKVAEGEFIITPAKTPEIEWQFRVLESNIGWAGNSRVATFELVNYGKPRNAGFQIIAWAGPDGRVETDATKVTLTSAKSGSWQVKAYGLTTDYQSEFVIPFIARF